MFSRDVLDGAAGAPRRVEHIRAVAGCRSQDLAIVFGLAGAHIVSGLNAVETGEQPSAGAVDL